MKKQLLILLILMSIPVFCLSAFSQEPILLQPSPRPEDLWFMLDEQQKVLTITLPANATTGYEWVYEISDAEVLELVNQEYLSCDKEEKLAGVGGTWTASFQGVFKAEGEAELILNYKRSWEDEPIQTRLVRVKTLENGKLEIILGELILAVQEFAES